MSTPATQPTHSDSAGPGARLSQEELSGAVSAALLKVDALLLKSGGGFPDATTVKGRYSFHQTSGITDGNAWTSGFWPGMLWLAYELSGRARYREAALPYVALFRQRLEAQLWVDHHDLGFLYSLSCVSAYKLTGDTLARETALLAARRLLGRYKVKGDFIQAWGDLNDPSSHRLIIDCLLNLPLLYWAAQETGESSFKETAVRHLRTTLAHVIRPDASTYHTFFFDPESGSPSHGVTKQGFSDESCWARGQAWGVCGIPLSRRYLDDDSILEAHARITDTFLARLPQDKVCYWDLIFTEGSEERDSSASAIAVCGLLEALPYLKDPARRERYESAAHAIVRSLASHYATGNTEDGLLSHAVYSKPHKAGVDECAIWGDYFYLETLLRLSKPWNPYW